MIRATQKRVSIKNVQARRAPSHSGLLPVYLGFFSLACPQENSKFLFALSQRFPVAFWARAAALSTFSSPGWNGSWGWPLIAISPMLPALIPLLPT